MGFALGFLMGFHMVLILSWVWDGFPVGFGVILSCFWFDFVFGKSSIEMGCNGGSWVVLGCYGGGGGLVEVDVGSFFFFFFFTMKVESSLLLHSEVKRVQGEDVREKNNKQIGYKAT